MAYNLLTNVFTLLSLPIIALLYCIFLRPLFNPLNKLPGPKSESIWFGNTHENILKEPGVGISGWTKGGEGVVRFRGWLGTTKLTFTDPLAINHILMNAYTFPRPISSRGFLGLILGHGLIVAEGDDHRRQRKIMTPAFAPQHLKDLLPAIFKYSYKLRDKWQEKILNCSPDERAFATPSPSAIENYKKAGKEGEVLIEVSSWLGRTTLDIIGSTGFGYEFNTLEDTYSELGKTFSNLVPTNARTPSMLRSLIQRSLGALVVTVPWIKHLPIPFFQETKVAFGRVEKAAREVLRVKREEDEAGDEMGSKDLIQLLLKSNSQDAKNQMSDEELSGQMTTMILAGHETTATALTWTLLELCKHKDVQKKLREEVQKAMSGGDELSYDELMGLEYLDAVCREILRFRPPVAYTARVASTSSLIPLSAPLTLSNGETISSLFVPKGTGMMFSHNTINCNKSIFGEDAEMFRPERWIERDIGGGGGEKEGKLHTVGVYSHLMTFISGPRGCIGYRFAILELKAILAVLISDFTFDLRNEGFEVERRTQVVTRPVVKGEESLGYRLPLNVRLATKD